VSFRAVDLSIVIPTRQRWETLTLTLSALEAQTASGFEVVVVADGMDQEIPSPLPGAARVVQQEHAGPGAARNRGVASTERPLVMFIGDDMIPRSDFVAAHVERHSVRPKPNVAVLGRIVWHESVPRNRLHRWLDWSGALFDYELLERQGQEDAGWPRFYSSNVSMKRSLFDAAGGFDPDFLFDYEDLDFGYRLGEHGMQLLYEPRAEVRHLHRYDWERVRRRYESRAGAEQLMMAKHSWFKPWFRGQIDAATSAPPASRLWALAVDYVPQRPASVRRAFERRATNWYLQRLAPSFNAAWARAAER
jgi:GT2 family glycosyltransferase